VDPRAGSVGSAPSGGTLPLVADRVAAGRPGTRRGQRGTHIPGQVALVEGSCFAVSGSGGDMAGGTTAEHLQGLFFRDVRILSQWQLLVNGETPEPLAVAEDEPFAATFVSRAHAAAAQPEPSLVVLRSRWVGQGMTEEIEIRNFGEEAAYCSVDVLVGADFAGLFAVREGTGLEPEGEPIIEADGGSMVLRQRRAGVRRGVRIAFAPQAKVGEGGASFELIVPAGGSWSTCIEVIPVAEGEDIVPRHRCGEIPEHSAPAERLARWRKQVPMVETDYAALRTALARSAEDLGALRLFDPDHPERVVVAAGLPWFMTLFGRDSLLASWMALPLDPDLALGVLQTLARFQGSDVDPRTEEEPGRILHEVRFRESVSLSLDGGHIYYGTADATPLFVMLLGELRRWGLAREVVEELLPHADRALAWVTDFGDRDGDGFVEYQRTTDRGLVNQGWKDSAGAIRFADGRPAETPLAVCEVQAYTYAAYVARGHFAREAGDEAGALHWHARAAALREAFNRDFWDDRRRSFVLALDRDKRPVDALASNIGHCLWTGIIDEDKAAAVAEHLVSPQMFTGWGVRTLASSMGGYNPVSYHCGSVWPHDTAIAAAGLMRYGFVEEAHRVITGLLDAAARQGGRLPELFSGLDRQELDAVVPHPAACSPQACASAAPLLLLRSLLRLDPWVPQGKVWLAPVLPEEVGTIVVDRVPLGGARVRIEATGTALKVEGLPAELELVQAGRRPTTAG